MPFKNLPDAAFKIWEKVYEANKGKVGEQRAAKMAWGAVKQAGWKRDKDGKWTKKAELAEFSLTIKKAYYDEKTQTMRWKADASDTEDDSYSDNMSLELFADFLSRIETKESPPEQFRSDFWAGGMPYMSISHFHDQNGNAVPGAVETVYVDGKFLKSKGTFSDTPLGRACFNSLCKDASGETDQKVRVSIAFLDWMHKHKSNGYVFERKSLSDLCPECFKEFLEQESHGKTYLKGHLIHLALTRVPVNKRTLMEVELSMTTQKDDAASIVGEELAEKLEEDEKALVGKSEALVTRAKGECPECGGKMENGECKECGYSEDESSEKDEEKKSEAVAPLPGTVPEVVEAVSARKDVTPKEDKQDSDVDRILQAIHELEKSFAVHTPTKETPHVLDEIFAQFRADFDSVMLSDVAPDEKLQSLQGAFNVLGSEIIKHVKGASAPKEPEASDGNEFAKALSLALAPLAQKLDLLSAQLTDRAQPKPSAPVRRSLDPQQLQQLVPATKSITPKLRALVEQTTY